MGEPTYFIDDVAKSTRSGEVPLASFEDGMNYGGSCACGIGINMNEGAVVGTPEQFTLLDQFENARAAQISQHIGGSGLGDGSSGTLPDSIIRFGDNPVDSDGVIVFVGDCTLTTIEEGWVEAPI